MIGRVALPPESELRLADLTIEAKVFLRPPSMSGPTDEVQEYWNAYGEFMRSEHGKAFRRDKIAVNADGTFRIEGLPETSYVIQVSATGKGLESGCLCRQASDRPAFVRLEGALRRRRTGSRAARGHPLTLQR